MKDPRNEVGVFRILFISKGVLNCVHLSDSIINSFSLGKTCEVLIFLLKTPPWLVFNELRDEIRSFGQGASYWNGKPIMTSLPVFRRFGNTRSFSTGSAKILHVKTKLAFRILTVAIRVFESQVSVKNKILVMTNKYNRWESCCKGGCKGENCLTTILKFRFSLLQATRNVVCAFILGPCSQNTWMIA